VAHEVRNNLLPVSLYLSLLRRRLSDDRGSLDVLDKVEAGVQSLDVTVNDLLHFTSERDPSLTSFRLTELFDDVRQSLAPQFEAQQIDCKVQVAAGLSLTADREMLRRAVLNLVLNAVDALPEGGELTLTGVATSRGVEIEVADNGPGLSDEVRRRAFEPFFTTKSNGTGLGLAIVYRVAEVHGGDVSAANCPEGGAAFTLRLPHRALEAAA
jgi:signal transduction histidine kinase